MADMMIILVLAAFGIIGYRLIGLLEKLLDRPCSRHK